MTAVSKNMHIDVTSGMYFKYDVDHNDKDPKFKVGDHVRISKYKNVFGNGYTLNQSEEVFLIRKVKNTVPWTHIISDLNNEQVVGTFYEKEMQKKDKLKKFLIEKLIKRKDDRLYDRLSNSLYDRWQSNGRVYSVAGLKWKIQYKDDSIFSSII